MLREHAHDGPARAELYRLAQHRSHGAGDGRCAGSRACAVPECVTPARRCSTCPPLKNQHPPDPRRAGGRSAAGRAAGDADRFLVARQASRPGPSAAASSGNVASGSGRAGPLSNSASCATYRVSCGPNRGARRFDGDRRRAAPCPEGLAGAPHDRDDRRAHLVRARRRDRDAADGGSQRWLRWVRQPAGLLCTRGPRLRSTPRVRRSSMSSPE